MSPPPLRVGLVGANPDRGWARDAHVPALNALQGFSIQAVSARNRDIAEAARRSFGAEEAFADSLALVRAPEVDIVAVCVKVPEHRAIVLAALDAGKSVYCEWPLGRTTAEAMEMAEAAKVAGVHVAIGLQGRNAIAVRHAASLVEAGALGRPLSLNMVSPTAGWGSVMPEFYAYLQDQTHGATLSSITGGHSLAMIEAVVGPYRELTATGSSHQPTVAISGTDRTIERTGFDHLVIIGRHRSGCVSTLEVVGGTMTVPFRFDLRGATGSLKIEGGHPGGYQAGQLTLSGRPQVADQPAHSLPELTGPAVNLSSMYQRFGADIRDNTRTTPDFEDAVRLHRLLDLVALSAAEGRTVEVDIPAPADSD